MADRITNNNNNNNNNTGKRNFGQVGGGRPLFKEYSTVPEMWFEDIELEITQSNEKDIHVKVTGNANRMPGANNVKKITTRVSLQYGLDVENDVDNLKEIFLIERHGTSDFTLFQFPGGEPIEGESDPVKEEFDFAFDLAAISRLYDIHALPDYESKAVPIITVQLHDYDENNNIQLPFLSYAYDIKIHSTLPEISRSLVQDTQTQTALKIVISGLEGEQRIKNNKNNNIALFTLLNITSRVAAQRKLLLTSLGNADVTLAGLAAFEQHIRVVHQDIPSLGKLDAYKLAFEHADVGFKTRARDHVAYYAWLMRRTNVTDEHEATLARNYEKAVFYLALVADNNNEGQALRTLTQIIENPTTTPEIAYKLLVYISYILNTAMYEILETYLEQTGKGNLARMLANFAGDIPEEQFHTVIEGSLKNAVNLTFSLFPLTSRNGGASKNSNSYTFETYAPKFKRFQYEEVSEHDLSPGGDFVRGRNNRLHVRLAENAQLGREVVATAPIQAGDFVCEYLGVLVKGSIPDDAHEEYIFDIQIPRDEAEIDEAEADIPLEKYVKTDTESEESDETEDHYYINSNIVDEDVLNVTVISVYGYARLINHSIKKKNLKPVLRIINETPRVFFFALRNINRGDTLWYDYGDRRPGAPDWLRE